MQNITDCKGIFFFKYNIVEQFAHNTIGFSLHYICDILIASNILRHFFCKPPLDVLKVKFNRHHIITCAIQAAALIQTHLHNS